MSRIVWDALGERLYEVGLDRGVLYTLNSELEFSNGVPWNGLTAVDDNPGGHEAKPLYTGDVKVDAVYTYDEYGGTIKAYTYPAELEELLGEAKIVTGMYAGQQDRSLFGFCYRTLIGNGESGSEHGYKLHLVYNARVTDYSKSYSSINDSLDVRDIEIPFETFPVEFNDFYPFSEIVIDSRQFGAERIAWIENILYGSDNTIQPPRLPYPDELLSLFEDEDLTEDDWNGYPHNELLPSIDLFPGSATPGDHPTEAVIRRNGSVSTTILGGSTATFSPEEFVDVPSGYTISGVLSYHSSDSNVVAVLLGIDLGVDSLQFKNLSTYQSYVTLTVYFLLTEVTN